MKEVLEIIVGGLICVSFLWHVKTSEAECHGLGACQPTPHGLRALHPPRLPSGCHSLGEVLCRGVVLVRGLLSFLFLLLLLACLVTLNSLKSSFMQMHSTVLMFISAWKIQLDVISCICRALFKTGCNFWASCKWAEPKLREPAGELGVIQYVAFRSGSRPISYLKFCSWPVFSKHTGFLNMEVNVAMSFC